MSKKKTKENYPKHGRLWGIALLLGIGMRLCQIQLLVLSAKCSTLVLSDQNTFYHLLLGDLKSNVPYSEFSWA